MFYDSSDTLNRRVRLAQTEKVRYTLVMGDKEVEGKTVSVRVRQSRDTKLYERADFIRKVLGEGLNP